MQERREGMERKDVKFFEGAFSIRRRKIHRGRKRILRSTENRRQRNQELNALKLFCGTATISL